MDLEFTGELWHWRRGISSTEWTTSLFPKDGMYLVPVKDAVRRAEGLDVGETVTVRLTVAGPI